MNHTGSNTMKAIKRLVLQTEWRVTFCCWITSNSWRIHHEHTWKRASNKPHCFNQKNHSISKITQNISHYNCKRSTASKSAPSWMTCEMTLTICNEFLFDWSYFVLNSWASYIRSDENTDDFHCEQEILQHSSDKHRMQCHVQR